ncbi:MAG: diaminopimelate epimerase [archaeon]|nr:diaminopimelate epimerase [archaeon]
MKFWKYQGCGNDFVVVDGITEKLEIDVPWCVKVCDRNFGIGADGVLYLLPGEDGCDITMRIINADGSEAEMCGNGIRCIAKHARDFGIMDKDEFSIHTGRGTLVATVFKGDDGKVRTVRIDMGAPILDARTVPVNYDGQFINQPFEIDGVKFHANAVSMGNPHFITFDDIGEKNVKKLGPRLESYREFFPRKTNVEFCRIEDGKIYITVYERGAAWTLACGTGACATTTAAALNKLVPFDTPVDVHLPGGWLKITVDSGLKYVLMEGPAVLVFEGSIE